MRIFKFSGAALCLFSLLFCSTASAQTAMLNQVVTVDAQKTTTPPRSDEQFWNETQIIKHLTEKRDLIFIGVVRVGRDLTQPVDERIGIGIAFKINKYLALIPTYLHVENQPTSNVKIHEERLIMNLTGKVSFGKFTFTDRNLLERRVRHSTPDFTVYRNRLQIDYPLKIGSFDFKPFVADEAWYSTQSNSEGSFGWYRNRISAGIIKQFNKHFTGEFFYLYQHDGRSRPGNIKVLGTLFRYTL
ncbi:MAG: DUF2490 domain-containing protein [Blastocatellia bacterium]|nr:DUF2490 domain-containing protein [Blastocatellia bacterium]